MPAATVLYGVCFTWMTAYLMNDAISAEMVRNEIRRGTAIAMRGLFPAPANLNYHRRCRTMIEIIGGFPDNVVGILAKGEVTRKDYLEVVIPAIDKALKRNAKLRLYYDLGSQFTGIDFGAEWEDFKLGIEHLSRWERAAVVTDVAWIRHLVGAFRFLIPENCESSRPPRHQRPGNGSSPPSDFDAPTVSRYCLVLRPAQTGHARIWLAAQSNQTSRRCGRVIWSVRQW